MDKYKLAHYGGEKTISKEFPWPVFSDKESTVVKNVVESGEWGISNSPDSYVARFEKQFADYTGVKHAISVVNGSVALRIALIAAGVKPGDEVIVPAMTFIATASIVIEANCIPVFVDIEPGTYNIDPAKIEQAITKKTKAIIPVHFGGHACNMDRIMEIAEKHNLFVLEDSCHGHGASHKGIKLGAIGDAGCFSFQSSKNMSCGEGGIIVTNNSELYEKIFALKNVGRKPGGKWYEHFYLGCNYRMGQFQAAILSCQLTRLDEQNMLRTENANYLRSLLKDIEGITSLEVASYVTEHSYHLYIMKYDKSGFKNLSKAAFADLLNSEGVPCFMGYPEPLYKQPVFQDKEFMCYTIPESVDYKDVHCPETEKACYEECMWINQSVLLGTKEDMELIAKAIKKIQENI